MFVTCSVVLQEPGQKKILFGSHIQKQKPIYSPALIRVCMWVRGWSQAGEEEEWGGGVPPNGLAGLAMLLLWVHLRPDNLGWLAFSVFSCGFFGIATFPVAYEVPCPPTGEVQERLGLQ